MDEFACSISGAGYRRNSLNWNLISTSEGGTIKWMILKQWSDFLLKLQGTEQSNYVLLSDYPKHRKAFFPCLQTWTELKSLLLDAGWHQMGWIHPPSAEFQPDPLRNMDEPSNYLRKAWYMVCCLPVFHCSLPANQKRLDGQESVWKIWPRRDIPASGVIQPELQSRTHYEQVQRPWWVWRPWTGSKYTRLYLWTWYRTTDKGRLHESMQTSWNSFNCPGK